jgi:hypothetical protein
MSQPLNHIGEPTERLISSALTDIFQLDVDEILAARRELVAA